MRSTTGLRTRSLNLSRGRAVAIVVAGLALMSVISAVRATAAGSGGTTAPASTCPTGTLAFSSNLTNGSMKIGRAASVSGGSAKACGALAMNAEGALTATVDKANVTFAPTETTVLFLKLPTRVAAVGNLSGPASIGADGQHVTLTGPVEATANILGAKCVLSIAPGLTTDTSRKLTGKPLADDGTGMLRGKLVANDFAVPAIRSSRECPLAIAALTNSLLGLPLAKGESSVTFDISLKLGV
jgi:hypothetical protein